LSTVLNWAAANPLYAFGGLVGLAVGVFYGFDGWSGNTANVEFKDSPRLKNLLWVLGPGVAAFFGDIKALDPDAKRSVLLLVYAAAWLGAGFLVVLLWGFVVGVSRLLQVLNRRDYGYHVGDALGDYFFYGYRFYRSKLDEYRARSEATADAATRRAVAEAEREKAAAEAAKENQSARFYAHYLAQLNYCVTASVAARANTRVQVVREILRAIAAVLKSYHNDDGESLHIRANLMVIEDCDAELRSRLLFVPENRKQTIARCLKLIAFDTDESQAQIVIPVSASLADALPGAPRALLHPAGFDVVDDVTAIAYPETVAPAIRKEISSYFAENLFRSFGSVRAIGRGETRGVLNVDARSPFIFGRSDAEKERVVKHLLPLATTLGVALSNP